MIPLRIVTRLFSKQVVPKAPQLLSGQLQPFRYQGENAQLYDGYTMDELYGIKAGVRHPPKVKAQMTKDTIGAWILFIVGFATILHLDWLFRKQQKDIRNAIESKLSRNITESEL